MRSRWVRLSVIGGAVVLAAGAAVVGLALVDDAPPAVADANAVRDEVAGTRFPGQGRLNPFERAIGFGGIFAFLKPKSGGAAPKADCTGYTEPGACNAVRNGDRWAADRIQNRRSTESEKAWYNR